MKLWKNTVLFYIGGLVYMSLELLFRGRSYGSMFLAGGVCFLLIGHLGKVEPRLPLLPRTLAGAGIVTMVELAAGMLVNREYEVWDYRDQPLNFMGQICPAFCLLWIPVSLLAILVFAWADRELEQKLRIAFSAEME